MRIDNRGGKSNVQEELFDPDEREERIGFFNGLLIVLSYLFFLPSFYLIFSERRFNQKVAFHASQAFLLWVSLIAVLTAVRWQIYVILSSNYIPLLTNVVPFLAGAAYIFMIYNAACFLLGKKVNVPVITFLSDRMA